MRTGILLLLLMVSTCTFCQSKEQLDSLTKVLEKISVDDQKYRLNWDLMIQKYGMNSPEFIDMLKNMSKQDSVNMLAVGNILDSFGWLSADQTSPDANEALFLVLQHGTLDFQLRYLPVMKKALEEKKTKASAYAMLVDRTNMYQGKLQVYGSQLNYDALGKLHIFPILDEPNLDTRRKAVGLPPMQEYLTYFTPSIIYTPAKKDRYQNKIVVEGTLMDQKEDKPLMGVSIFSSTGKLLGRTDSAGFFQLVIDKKSQGSKIIFRLAGFKPEEFVIENSDKDVIDVKSYLHKQ